jgi:phosphoribosylformylglycinamidine synthase
MAFTGDLGVDLEVGLVPVNEKMRNDYVLFSESNSRLLLEVKPRHVDEFNELMAGSAYACVGAVKKDKKLHVTLNGEQLIDLSLDDLISSWKLPLEVSRK